MININQKIKALSTLFFSILILSGCQPKEEERDNNVAFDGIVNNVSGESIESAIIEINGQSTKTDKEGRFEIKVDSAEKYVLKAKKANYASISNVYSSKQSKIRLTLFDATVKSFDPSKDISLTDVKSTNRPGPTLSRASFNSDFNKIPFVYKDGKLIDFGFSPQMKEAFNYVEQRKSAGAGISLSIPANSLVRNGSKPTGNVQVSLSTIDLFTASAMPGDMTVVDENGRRSGFMISYGAGSIEVFDEEGNYQLDKGTEAEISIPVDSSVHMMQGEIPKSVPLFYYNEESGFWSKDGSAFLNEDGSAYIGKLRHFSTFNMDIEKNTPACVQVRHNSVGVTTLSSYKVEAIVPVGSNIIHQERTIEDPSNSSTSWPVGDPAACLENSNGTSVHMLYNLPENTEVCLIFYEPGTPDVAINIAVTTTGPSYGSSLPTCPSVTCPSDPCAGGYGTCSYVPFSKLSDPIILAANSDGTGNVAFKWVYNNTPGTYTYKLYELDKDDFEGGIGETPIEPPLTTMATTSVDNPLEIKSFNAVGVTSGVHYYQVRIEENTDKSQVNDVNF